MLICYCKKNFSPGKVFHGLKRLEKASRDTFGLEIEKKVAKKHLILKFAYLSPRYLV